MNNLNLPRPKLIDEAVPANQQCGFERPDVSRSGDGVPEVSVEWVRAHADQVRLIDVRSADEFAGELGHIDGAELVELDSVEGTATEWNRDDRLVTICRSGGRSGRAAKALEQMGFRNVCSMAGGMLAWRQRSDAQ